MPITTLFLDLDDTFYPASSGIWAEIGVRIEQYIHNRLDLSVAEIPGLRRRLFEQYGTTLRGLQQTYGVDMEDYLAYVHDVPIEKMLSPDPKLREVILSLPQRKFIFTNADKRHAQRVLNALGLSDCIPDIIDIHSIAPACKPMVEAFQTACKIACVENPSETVFIDDSPRNLAAARALGFQIIQVNPHPAADNPFPTITRLHELPSALTDLMETKNVCP